MKDQFATSNEFLLTPNRHIAFGSSPTDAKYPGVSHPQPPVVGDDPTTLVEHLRTNKQKAKVKLPKLVGVKEQVMPPEFFNELKKQQNASRKAYRLMQEKMQNK